MICLSFSSALAVDDLLSRLRTAGITFQQSLCYIVVETVNLCIWALCSTNRLISAYTALSLHVGATPWSSISHSLAFVTTQSALQTVVWSGFDPEDIRLHVLSCFLVAQRLGQLEEAMTALSKLT